MPPRKKRHAPPNAERAVDYRYTGEKRTNIPPARIAGEGTVPTVPKARYAYSPHLSPMLQFDPTGEPDKLDALVDKATKGPLSAADATRLREALRVKEPTLEWAGKREQREKGFLEVDPVALHIHERVSARAIIRSALREDVQRDLFADPQQPYKEAVQFYKHDVDWANRLILGDSLQVLSSLARRENLAGKVQMIYMDPPYGIKYKSNFQPEVSRTDVKERVEDLSREPETVRAFRDTWHLGVHSYLTYLRDRFLVARELLTPSGSIFVQIGEDNVHRVRGLLDQVFGDENFVSEIVYLKTSGSTSDGLSAVHDVILWYRKSSAMKYRALFEIKKAGEAGATGYTRVLLGTGEIRSMGDFVVDGELRLPEGADLIAASDYTSQSPGSRYDNWLQGRCYRAEPGYWKTDEAGMSRIKRAERLMPGKKYPGYMRRISDFPAYPISNVWTDTLGQNQFGGKKIYATQTALKVVQRCMLMTTDPGDLVLDPTCGSGTTAYVAEFWGRRWISVDTSRVALSIARQRMIIARLPYFETRVVEDRDIRSNPQGAWLSVSDLDDARRTFNCRTVSRIQPSSITQNANLDPICDKHESILERLLLRCNEELRAVGADKRRILKEKLDKKRKQFGVRSLTEADRRRWLLPAAQFEHWTVPFDTDASWPQGLTTAVENYRGAWMAKMAEVDACVSDGAMQEELLDQPLSDSSKLRVCGPFTVEGVRPEELNIGDSGLFDGTPNNEEGAPAISASKENLHSYLSSMVQHLRQDGLTFLDNKHVAFARVEPLFESATGRFLHAEGVWSQSASLDDMSVAIVFGPQYGPVTSQLVEEAVRASRRYDELVVAGFSFDATATEDIRRLTTQRLRIHQAYIRPDINPGMHGLLEDTPGSQLFTVSGAPEIDISMTEDKEHVVELKGVDIYDPVASTVRSTGADKVAAWFLDTDFDGRCFCVTQAFFPDQDAWEKIAKALGSAADPDAFEAFKGTTSIPFAVGTHKRIAVKVIDPRGNEVMVVRALEG